jgi:small-conductance mechanosensitive channel
MNQQQQQFEKMSPKEQFKSIQILHIALMVGMILMFVMLWFFSPVVINMNPLDGTFSIILPFVMIAAIGGAVWLYNKQKDSIEANASLKQKMWNYRKISVMRWSLTEGASLACVLVFYFVESNISILFAFTLGLFAFSVFRPTVDGLATDFKLNQQEQNQLMKTIE